MPDDPAPLPPGNPARRAGTGLTGETTRGQDSTLRFEPNKPLEVIGDFEVLAELGQGGMGAVYRARQVSLDRQVALKLLPSNFEHDADYVARFQREARVAANLKHPNLVRVYTSGVAAGSHYIAMELVEGETLAHWIKRGPLPSLQALRIVLDVARALECGWRTAQLIHRDIKPGNIFLSQEGDVKLGDLGLAKIVGGESTTGLTQTGTAMGTPHYISPEQARGDKDLDFRADIYSLGCTLYQMLTGQTPYSGTDPVAIFHHHLHSPPPAILKVLPHCPLPLARLVAKMLKKQRRERFGSYEELIAQIESVRAQLDPALIAPATMTREDTRPTPAGVVGRVSSPAIGPEASGTPASEPAGGSGKLKLPLYGGIAGGLLVLGLVGWLAWPKEEKLTKAQIYAREHAGEVQAGAATPVPVANVAAANSSVAAEPWQDVLHDPAKLDLNGGAERTPEGLRFTDVGAAYLSPTQGPRRDGAARLRAAFEGFRLQVRVRARNDAGHYQLYPSNESLIVLSRWEQTTRQTTILRQFPLHEPLKQGQDYELELRIVGQTLTAKLNGEVLGTVMDGTFTEGQFGAGFGDHNAAPALVKSLEVLDLDAPLAGATATLAAEPWQDVLRDPPRSDIKGAGKRVADGVRFDGVGMVRPLRSPHHDGAIRIRAALGGSPVKLRARYGDAGNYALWVENEWQVNLTRWDNAAKKSVKLKEFSLAHSLKMGGDYELELRVVGATVTARMNGDLLGSVQDENITQGDFLIDVAERGTVPALVKALEVLDLDAPTRASATPPAATKDAPYVNTLGMKFVPVPITGGPTNGQPVLFSVWDARVQDYEAFVKETKREWPKPDFEQGPTHPAVNVSWEDAQAFCQWLTAREHLAGKLPAEWRYRLPSDHEWSCAVGLGAREDAAKLPSEKSQRINDTFPWGTEWPPPKGAGNYAGEELRPALVAGKYTYLKDVLAGYDDGFVNTSPVGSFAANRFGLYDIGGNVWQLCEDWLDKGQKYRVLRGASWASLGRGLLLSSSRFPYPPAQRMSDRGFRCVLAPVGMTAGGTRSVVSQTPANAAGNGTTATAPSASSDGRAGAGSPGGQPPLIPSAASVPSEATKDLPFVNTLGMKFVPVPIVGGVGRESQMEPGRRREAQSSPAVAGGDTGPTTRLLFNVWDTRVQDYAAFVKESKREWPKADFEQGPTHPAVNVSWEDAQLFCQWLTAREHLAGKLPAEWGYRLPSDHEWSCAVGLGAREDAAKLPSEKSQKINDAFPWGTEWPPPKGAGNYAGEELRPALAAGKYTNIKDVLAGYDDGFVNTSPVGSFAANRYGLYDMGGNVWLWCEDWFDKDQKDRVLRGASWTGHDRFNLLSSGRVRDTPGARGNGYGFRCVLGASVR